MSTALEVIGLAFVVAAFFTMSIPLGLLATGAALILLGVALEGRQEP